MTIHSFYPIPSIELTENMSVVFATLADMPAIAIEKVNWEKKFPYKPACTVQLAWHVSGIFLLFTVTEQQTIANETNLHGNVCNDSCVEFFVSFDNCASYFNFEFNAVGSIHASYRHCNGQHKQVLTNDELASIYTQTSYDKFCKIAVQNSHWTLGVYLPATLFGIDNWTERTLWGNFYKCGDGLDQPHYLSWKPIISEKPKFHLPQFFGALRCV
jgi:hypothetical protein